MNWSPLLLEPQQLENWDGLIVDARTAPRYAAGHIPNAISLPMVSIRQEQGSAVLISEPVSFAQRVGEAGVDAKTPIVLYGERGQPDAGYLFWAFSYYGHAHVYLLDGGIEAWRGAGFPLTTDPFTAVPTTFAAKPQPERRVQAQWLVEHLEDEHVCLLDNRTDLEYSGKEVLALRGGRIPNAKWLPWETLLQPDLRFKPEVELRTLFQQAGLEPEQTAVVYCQTGNRSGAAYVGLRLLNHRDVRMYDGSWGQWGNDPQLPLEGGNV